MTPARPYICRRSVLSRLMLALDRAVAPRLGDRALDRAGVLPQGPDKPSQDMDIGSGRPRHRSRAASPVRLEFVSFQPILGLRTPPSLRLRHALSSTPIGSICTDP
jgi:hypothetical protein